MTPVCEDPDALLQRIADDMLILLHARAVWGPPDERCVTLACERLRTWRMQLAWIREQRRPVERDWEAGIWMGMVGVSIGLALGIMLGRIMG